MHELLGLGELLPVVHNVHELCSVNQVVAVNVKELESISYVLSPPLRESCGDLMDVETAISVQINRVEELGGSHASASDDVSDKLQRVLSLLLSKPRRAHFRTRARNINWLGWTRFSRRQLAGDLVERVISCTNLDSLASILFKVGNEFSQSDFTIPI